MGTDLASVGRAMEISRLSRALLITLILTVAGVSASSAASQPVRGGFLYTLAGFTGPLRDNFSRVASDRERNEVYVLYQNVVTVFNDSGMEIYRFGDNLDLGQIVDVAVDREGDIFLLTFRDSRSAVVRCNYRGEPKSVIELQNFPAAFSDFNPNRMIYRQGSLYLASLFTMKLAIVDLEGNFKNGYDLLPLFELEEKDRGNVEVSGFYVDADGSIVMTVPALFRAFILSPDGTLTWFGKPGGAPGRFNIVAGIARDKRGNYLVVDRLKGSVLVFDKSFNFVTQFAVRGYGPGDLIFPNDIAMDNSDRIYVTQMGKRGVSVYRLTYN
jgi:hypothetical protein